MAKRSSSSLWYSLALISILSLLINRITLSPVAADSHFEGFDAEEDDAAAALEDESLQLNDLPRRTPITATVTQSQAESDHAPPDESIPEPLDQSRQTTDLRAKSDFYWDEDEFEGLPEEETQLSAKSAEELTPEAETDDDSITDAKGATKSTTYRFPQSFVVEIVCASFLIMFVINYFTGKKKNEKIALSWATKFAGRDSIFEKNFSLLGVGEGDDSPLLLKEGQNVFKFYASGRRFCQGLLATIELQSRHDLISRLYNAVVRSKDEITFEVYMNDDAMDQVVFALAKKKVAKTMQKEVIDLQRFANLITPPSNRKWATEDFTAVSESKEVAGDLITDTVIEQVFGEKAFEKHGKGFISMHFSDQHPGGQRKALVFKFALPDINQMSDMSRLVALVPYYIDLIGRYKLSSQARSKTEAARQKAAQEAYKEYQNARQENLQKKKAERRKILEEAEAKLSAEAIRKKESKEKSRQLKKAMPKMKMTRAH